jgi:hypothetical protein
MARLLNILNIRQHHQAPARCFAIIVPENWRIEVFAGDERIVAVVAEIHWDGKVAACRAAATNRAAGLNSAACKLVRNLAL